MKVNYIEGYSDSLELEYLPDLYCEPGELYYYFFYEIDNKIKKLFVTEIQQDNGDINLIVPEGF